MNYSIIILSLLLVGISMPACGDHTEEIYDLGTIQANNGTVDDTSRSFLDLEFSEIASSDDVSGLAIGTVLETDISN